jgi:transcriptional regulator with XRE-family HTH domain
MQLAAYLSQNGLTVPKFGREVGVPNRQTMYQYAKGMRFPPPDVLARIADKTGGKVTADDFVRHYMAAKSTGVAQASAA